MADPSNLPPLPKDHLDHPESWATGQDPATSKQKGFIKVLEGQHANLVPEEGLDVDGLGKSEASEVIDHLKKGEPVASAESKKRKEPPSTSTDTADDGSSAAPKPDAGQVKGGTKSKVNGGKSADGKATVTKNAPGADEDDPIVVDDEDEEQEQEKPKKSSTNPENGHVEKKIKVTEEGDQVDGTTSQPDIDVDEKEKQVPSRPSNPVPNDRPEQDISAPPLSSSQDEGLVTASANSKPNDGAADDKGDTIPGDGAHLDHPENWATGDEPATEKQKAFVAVLEKQKGVSVDHKEGLGKSEASEKIDEMKNM